jgi:hypothetical protein
MLVVRNERVLKMLFTDSDYQPIISHSFSNPMIDTVLSVLAKDVLPEISLFLPEKARALEKRILPFCQELSAFVIQMEILPPKLADLEHLKRLMYTARSEEKTRSWLSNLEIPPQMNIIVSYDFNTALLMPWSIFMRHYDDFCYYGGYDICVCSVDEQWYLLYYHEDIFLFGRRRIEE